MATCTVTSVPIMTAILVTVPVYAVAAGTLTTAFRQYIPLCPQKPQQLNSEGWLIGTVDKS